MTSSSPKHLSKFDSILWFWTKTGGTQFAAHYLRGAVIGRLEERWVQQGKPRLARRSFLPQPGEKECFKLKTMELLSWGFAGLSGPRSGTILLTESAHNGFKLDLSGIFQGTRSCMCATYSGIRTSEVYFMQVWHFLWQSLVDKWRGSKKQLTWRCPQTRRKPRRPSIQSCWDSPLGRSEKKVMMMLMTCQLVFRFSFHEGKFQITECLTLWLWFLSLAMFPSSPSI